MNSKVPDGWDWTSIGKLADPNCKAIVSGPFGSNIGSRFFVGEGIPLIRGNNLTTDMTKFVDTGFVYITEEKAYELRNCEAVADDLIFTAAGSLGQVGIIPRNSRYSRYVISNKQMRVRVDKTQLEPLFAFYWFSSKKMRDYIQQRNTGSSVPLINLGVLRALPLPLPPLPEQRAIASILGALDDKIELNRQMNHTLEQMAQALFQSWFVDFDPVWAKKEGRQPFGMDAGTADLFPDEFEESELGLIPKGWRLANISDVADLNAWSLKKSDALDVLHYIEISEVSRGDVANVQIYERGTEPSRARRRLSHGDTVLSTVRPDRKSYFLSLNPAPNAVVSTGFAVISPRTVPWSFAHTALTQATMFEYLGHLADGGAYPAVRTDVIGSWNVVLAPDKLLQKFHQVVSPLYMKANCNRRESLVLAEIRDTLLPKLISGELRVPMDAESVVTQEVTLHDA